MPKALTQRRDHDPAHPYLRPQIPSPRRSRRTAAGQDTVDPRVAVADTPVHPLAFPLDLVVPAEHALAGGGQPAQRFKAFMVAVAVLQLRGTWLAVFSMIADESIVDLTLRTRRYLRIPSHFTILPKLH
ncbi:uncharacterized protein ARMOST_03899 [Armillaria ostoyae]|uniref:Uncharacterized protein n=1 Tax=Armillaria ostoyae TaxID=47428 RepID=A0A284QVU4_ARMOS|nr:uncharacterized protein ARMOST_03899 [Armillaria ostoyae]